MKPQRDFNPVEHIGTKGAESQFTIASNAQAFEILSAGIYTDPIAAVIRELSCNAYDSHVENGTPKKPFEIHLPNKLEPHFSVIDHGIGLSDDQIRSLFSTYFQSSKTDTNTQIGAFGLGSKSPFSYSKSFTIISRYDGKQRTYSVYVNDDGVPTIEENAKIDTQECNGIEVRLAVRSQDYDTFAETTRKTLRYFPVKPIVKGRSEFQWPKQSDTATVTDTYIVDKEDRGLFAVQGNVNYKVSQSQIESLLESGARRFMQHHRIVLFFDIGLIGIAANREEVRYDETSAKNIADALNVAFEDYLVQLDDHMTELTKTGSKWEIFLTLRNKFGSKSQLEQLVGKNYKFESDMANEWMKNDTLEYSMDWKYHKIIPYQRGDLRAVRAHHDTEGFGKDRTYHIRPDVGKQVVVQDVTKRGSMRMNTKLVRGYQSGGTKTIMAIVPTTDRALANAGITASSQDRATELAKIVEQFGNPEVKIVSEWTEDVAQQARAARASGHTFKTFQAPTRRAKTVKPVFVETAEPDDGGLYLEIDLLRNILIDGTPTHISGKELDNMLTPVLNVINIAKGTEYTPSDVFGLTKKVVKYVTAKDEWTSLVEVYKEAIEDQMNVIEYYKRIDNSTTLNLNHYITNHRFVRMVKSLDTKSEFRALVEPVIDMSTEAVALASHKDHPVEKDDFRQHLAYFNQYFKIEHDVKDDSFFNRADFTDYHMLRHINFSYQEDAKDAEKYIKMIEG